ncbi:hypothetical protein D3C85_1160890 [compost metagenome]
MEPCIDITAGAAHRKVVVGLLLEDFKRSGFETAERVVELAFAAVIQHVQARLQVIVEGMAQAHAQRFIAVGVMVAVAGV